MLHLTGCERAVDTEPQVQTRIRLNQHGEPVEVVAILRQPDTGQCLVLYRRPVRRDQMHMTVREFLQQFEAA